MAEDQGGFTLNPLVLYERLKNSFAEFVSNLGHGLVIIFGIENLTLDTVVKLENQFEELVTSTTDFVNEIKNFKFNPAWKTRVIWVPQAIEAAQMLWEKVHVDLIDRIKEIQTPFRNFKETVHELKQGLASAGAGDGSSAAARKVNQIEVTVRALNAMLAEVSDALQKIQNFESLLDELTHEFETLDSFFMPQSKPERQKDGLHRSRR